MKLNSEQVNSYRNVFHRKGHQGLSVTMPIWVCHWVATLWLSHNACQTEGTRRVLLVLCWSLHWHGITTHSKVAGGCWRWCVGIPGGKDPGTGQEAAVLDTWLMHAHDVLLSGFFRKNSKTWDKLDYTHGIHTEIHNIYILNSCLVRWLEKDWQIGFLGNSALPYFPVHHSPVGLPA